MRSRAGVALSVLHGVRAEDMPVAVGSGIKPVLNTPAQVKRWRAAGHALCDVMIDTGMNRLGLSVEDVAAGLLDGLQIDTLMSHLASADEDTAAARRQTAGQLRAFAGLAGRTSARRLSLANSAGIALGPDYAFDLTRPGLALYGGVPRAELRALRQVVSPEAQVLQRRLVRDGQPVGYNACWRARGDTPVAIVNLGYADGYFRGFSNTGIAYAGEHALPVIGRVSMDLVALDVSRAPDLAEGDWVAFEFALPETADRSGMSQYELLTSIGRRYARLWE